MNQVLKDICVGSREENRKALCAYEEVAKTFEQVECPVLHYMHGGMYAREVVIPKDTILTGAIYKFDHLDIMISGDVTVTTDTGETKRFTGYNCLKGLSGKKRAGITHEETVWITIHVAKGSHGDDIQRFLTVDSFEDLANFTRLVNQEDFRRLLLDLGMTAEQMTAQANIMIDRIDMPEGYDHLYTAPSDLAGVGFYTSEKLLAGITVCPARIGDKRTPAGCYTNHATNANCVLRGLSYVALRDIEAGEEITVNYRQVLSARHQQGDLCPE